METDRLSLISNFFLAFDFRGMIIASRFMNFCTLGSWAYLTDDRALTLSYFVASSGGLISKITGAFYS